MILDEATRVVDAETGTIMQDISDQEFRDVTVLAVMRRLEHVPKYDKVALLDRGRLVDSSNLKELLAQKGSEFAALYHASEKW